jgi:hypothetical protein
MQEQLKFETGPSWSILSFTKRMLLHCKIEVHTQAERAGAIPASSADAR